ncbi:MAG: hypothetical protein MUP70_14440 [Candidatus Aminicenantes bacterium]|nr:hypothetical protein [Candidatus Aminicenantes bacterium]
MNKKFLIIWIAVGLMVSAVGLSAVDVSGEWEMTSQGRQGEQTSTIKIVQDGENITVTMPGRGRGGEVGEPMEAQGTIKGNDIQWKVVRETQRGTFEMVYTGTVDGDSMSGQMTMSMGDRTSDWTATRKK